MSSAVQMNVRIDPSLKEQGDRVLAQHGMSPSQGIRAFYSSLAGTKKQSEKMFEAMNLSGGESDAKLEKDTKLTSVRAVQRLIASMNESFGIKPRTSVFERISDKELLEDAIVEAYSDGSGA